MSVILQDRLEAVKDIPLSVGGHSAPAAGETPCAFCAEEKWAWITGLDWTDRPENKSSVISAFIRRFQDSCDQDGRDRVDAWQLANADRLVATANDGHDDARGFLATDWACRVALPLWLDVAGATEAAAVLRARGEVTDRAEAGAIRKAINDIRKELSFPGWYEVRQDLIRRVREAVAAYAKENLPAEAAWAAEAAEAAWAAEAAEAAGAAGAAEAAWAAEAAEAAFRREVREAVRARVLEAWSNRFEPTTTSVKASAVELLDRMVAVGE